MSPIRHLITEWQPPGFSDGAFVAGVLPLMVAGVVVLLRAPRRWSEILAFGIMAALALEAIRDLPLFALVTAPAIAAGVSRYVPETARPNTILRERPVALLVGFATIAAAFIVAFSFVHVYERTTLPGRAVEAAAGMPGVRYVYCEDFAWCSLALSHPNMREFIDGRCDPFPLHVWSKYETVYRVASGWQSALNDAHVNTVIAQRGHKLARALAMQPGWRTGYQDRTYRVFVRL